MNCLKCGRETDQTFCEACREEMTRYPVKPGTIVQLPKDRSASYPRRSQDWRDTVSPETQIKNQKRIIRRLASASRSTSRSSIMAAWHPRWPC